MIMAGFEWEKGNQRETRPTGISKPPEQCDTTQYIRAATYHGMKHEATYEAVYIVVWWYTTQRHFVALYKVHCSM